MIQSLLWYLVIGVIGFLSLPLAQYLLPSLERPRVCIQPGAGVDAHRIHLLATDILQDPAE